MRVVSWNINSLRARLPRVQGFLERHAPDVLCLQETKVQDASFPQLAFMGDGYTCTVHGQPTYNGVAILSKERPDEVVRGFSGNPVPEQARCLWARFGDLWIGNHYVVNGKHVDDPAYLVKLQWLEALHDHVDALVQGDQQALLVGDWNVAPTPHDTHDPNAWEGNILCTHAERQRLSNIMALGYSDLHRNFVEGPGPFTWWDYRGLGFQKNEGLRIDLALGSEGVADACKDVWVDRDERKVGNWAEKPSDHAPLVVDLA